MAYYTTADYSLVLFKSLHYYCIYYRSGRAWKNVIFWEACRNFLWAAS